MTLRHLCLAGAACAGLFARAGVRYVAPDGTGDGSSWAAAASFDTAYEAASAAGGGEIWLKKGTYPRTTGCRLATGVVLRGGFAGTESSAAAADPAANPTTFEGMIAKNTYCQYAFTNATGNAVTGCEFHGLVFTNFYNAAIFANAGLVEDAVISHCTFTDTQLADASKAAIVINGWKNGRMTDCTIKRNYNGIMQVYATNAYTRCTFCENKIFPWSVGGPLHIYGSYGAKGNVRNSHAVINDCTFTNNLDYNHQSCGNATGVKIDYASAVMSNCLFAENRAIRDGGGCNCRGVIALCQGCATLSMYGCAIRKNVSLQSGQAGACCLCIEGGFVTAENCSFTDNVLTNTGGTFCHCSVIATLGASAASGNSTFVNCTITGNRAVTQVEGGKIGTFITDCSYSRETGFVNCTIANNVVEATEGVTPAFCAECVNAATASGHGDMFFNTVVKGAGSGGHPFYQKTAGTTPRLTAVRSAIYDYPGQTITEADMSYSQTPYTNGLGQIVIPMVDAVLSDRYRTTAPAGVWQRGIMPDSPCRRTGWLYWKGTDGGWWYHDEQSKGYMMGCRRVNLSEIKYGGYISSYVPGHETLPAYHDAIGRDRKRGKVSVGPIVPIGGTAIAFR